ncbi:MAG: hypothetical protein Q8O56_00430 [Solirubrobacteraceae bacterium]|nr:hypothetical protein [Solirubrobacteraceae bacterium]
MRDGAPILVAGEALYDLVADPGGALSGHPGWRAGASPPHVPAGAAGRPLGPADLS